MSQQHPYNRGYNSAIARVETDGMDSARRWLVQRMSDTTKPALDDRYVNRHWVKIFVESQAWNVHVERGDLLVACSVATGVAGTVTGSRTGARGFE